VRNPAAVRKWQGIHGTRDPYDQKDRSAKAPLAQDVTGD
jgi:hypothetical protein